MEGEHPKKERKERRPHLALLNRTLFSFLQGIFNNSFFLHYLMMLLPALFSVSQILAEVALLDNAGSGIIYSSVSNGEFAAVLEVAIFWGPGGELHESHFG